MNENSQLVPVIGAGSIGKRHFNNLQSLGVQTELLSFRHHNVESLDAYFAGHKNITGVVIATATQIRLELIRLCVKYRYPFYVEKPLAYSVAELVEIQAIAEPLANRSIVGFMMRYHPFFRRMTHLNLSDIYRFSFIIGHDVNQWRENWDFSKSYAATSQGGGVLLDLCHEIDMAACLFPNLRLGSVDCVGHRRFDGVDFATQLNFSGKPQGVVAMDYVSAVGMRQVMLFGQTKNYQFDFVNLSHNFDNKVESIEFERNEMFRAAMSDFIRLIQDKPVSNVEFLPRFDLVQSSCQLIANAWEQRQFSGYLEDETE